MSQIQGLGGIVRSSKSTDIQDVPNEVLGYIFEKYVKEGQSPWLLTLVSRLWRIVSLADPNLWRYIRISEVGFSPKSAYTKWIIQNGSFTVINYRNRQVCSDLDDLIQAISRTGSTTLDVKIGPLPDGVEDLVKLIFTSPISSRIVHLEFIDDHWFSYAMVKEELGPFSALKKLIIPPRTKNLPPLLPLIYSIQDTALNLREFHLKTLLNQELNQESMKALLSRLHFLTMTPDGAAEVDIFARYCSHLIGLTCSSREWPNETARVDVLRNIQILSLNCRPESLRYLHLGSLQELTLKDYTKPLFQRRPWDTPEPVYPPSPSPWEGPECVELPSLVTLRVESHSFAWLMHLQVPHLRKLSLRIRPGCICHNSDREIQLSDLKCILKPSFWSGLPSSLSKLTLKASCTDENFISILSTITNIQSLTLVPKHDRKDPQHRSQILDRLGGIFTEGLLPQLEIFIFGDTSWPIYQLRETLDSQVHHILKKESRGAKRCSALMCTGRMAQCLA